MIFLILAAIGFALALLHVAFQKRPRTRRGVADTLLLYLFAVPVGLGGLLGFVGHTMRAGPVAASIGWPAGNPFQYEVAVANLAFGILGLLCLRLRAGFWTATAMGWSVFLLGAAAVHLRQIHVGQPYAPENAGAILYFDIGAPACLLALLAIRNAGTNSTGRAIP
jgi:hypothetical protein